MIKTHWVRVAVACGTALTLSLSLGCCTVGVDTSAATLCQETEMAGISLSLDKFYEVNFEQETDETVADQTDANGTTPSAVTQATQAPAATATPQATAKPKATPTVSKQFKNTALSIAGDYVNIRKSPSTNAKILGKLYEGSSAKVLSTSKGWSKIESGSVTGYIKSEFLATGEKAEKLASKYGTYYAKVKPGTITLNVRAKANTSCTIITQIPEDESYKVLSIGENWVKITIDGEKGYVAKEFVNLRAKFKKAVSLKEEEAERKRIAAAEAAEQERLEQLRREQAAANSSSSNSNSSSNSSRSTGTTTRSTGSTNRSTGSTKSSNTTQKSTSTKSTGSTQSNRSYTGSSSGSEIAAYAQKFVGNRYVYGGSSLTRGTDCSGFTMSVYLQFGYSLPHSSAAQASCGRKVSLSSVQPGDLIFYRNGSRIGHVAMYIGGGRVVHASNPSDGIKISSMRYRTPACARRIVG